MMEEEFIRSASGDETVTDDKEATIRNLLAVREEMITEVGRLDSVISEQAIEIERLRGQLKVIQAAWHSRCEAADHLAAEIERVRTEVGELLNLNKILVYSNKMAKAEIERLRAAIIPYLDFARDVGVSPVAPELRPIREAMRAAIADEQPAEQKK